MIAMANLNNQWTDNYLFQTSTKRLFDEIFENASGFLEEYKKSAFAGAISDDNVTKLYYLLYARHGNDPIVNLDENQFKYRVWSTIFMYGPTWQRKLALQTSLQNLTDDELMAASVSISNHAVNPSTLPTTLTDEILDYIDEQNVGKNKRGKIDAYGMLQELLREDVTIRFLARFDNLFSPMLEQPMWYWQKEE